SATIFGSSSVTMANRLPSWHASNMLASPTPTTGILATSLASWIAGSRKHRTMAASQPAACAASACSTIPRLFSKEKYALLASGARDRAGVTLSISAVVSARRARSIERWRTGRNRCELSAVLMLMQRILDIIAPLNQSMGRPGRSVGGGTEAGYLHAAFDL